MADKEDTEGTASRGNEWEVVSLTASAYAAAPSPKKVELKDDEKGGTVGENKGETSNTLFMSGHFVFPPSQHENLPLEPEDTEIRDEHGGDDDVPEFVAEEGGKSYTKDEENWDINALTMSDDFPGIQFFDKESKMLSISGTGFEESAALEGLNLIDKEQSMYSTTKFGSFHSESTMGSSTLFDENRAINEPIEPSDPSLDSDILHSAKHTDKDNDDASNLPSAAWWKRRAASLYAHAKEANSFWSIFIAATVMGLVILGQQWQQERWQVLQLKWQFGISDERMGRMLGPLSRFKDVIVGGHRRGSFIRGSTSTER